ncbi:hypothetical protein SCHPADRAFT_944734 [Schizopora paradoxa]|uniref:Uncharacterized protein n=1 Tax=Schizopora paradoxa TaxID=27342 RepID=A0A0H2REX1_9AGAM|nr:hypothetical protein SCHPADRAFT_944734 [Schizopora paradoxa]
MPSLLKFFRRRRGTRTSSTTSIALREASAESSQVVVRRPSPIPSPSESSPLGQITATEVGSSSRTLDVVKLALSLTESAAEAIPVAGSPMKAAIGGVLKILDLFDVRDKNKKQAIRLVRKLKDLDKRIDWTKSNESNGDMSPHLEELIRQLNGVRDALMYSYTKADSIIRNSSVTDQLRDLENEIDDFLSSYNFSATMTIESAVTALNSLVAGTDGANTLVRLAQSHVENSAINLRAEAGVDFIDPRGRKTRVSLNFLISYEQFQKYLHLYYDVGTKFEYRGAKYVETGQYLLSCGNVDVDDSNWSILSDTHEPLEMFMILQEWRVDVVLDFVEVNHCPRCGAHLKSSNLASSSFTGVAISTIGGTHVLAIW